MYVDGERSTTTASHIKMPAITLRYTRDMTANTRVEMRRPQSARGPASWDGCDFTMQVCISHWHTCGTSNHKRTAARCRVQRVSLCAKTDAAFQFSFRALIRRKGINKQCSRCDGDRTGQPRPASDNALQGRHHSSSWLINRQRYAV